MSSKSRKTIPAVSAEDMASQFETGVSEVEEANAMAAATKPIEGDLPRIFLQLKPEAHSAWKSRYERDGLSWKALLVTSRVLYARGELVSTERHVESDAPLVTLTLEDLEKKVVPAHLEYTSTLPVNGRFALKEFEDAQGNLAFAKDKNRGADFSAVEKIKEQIKRLILSTVGKEDDSAVNRQILELSQSLKETTDETVIAHLSQRTLGLAKSKDKDESIGLVKAMKAFLTSKIEPISKDDPRTARNLLMNEIRKLESDGARDGDKGGFTNQPQQTRFVKRDRYSGARR